MKNKLGLMMAAMVFAGYWQNALCEFTLKHTIRNEDVGASKNGFGWDLAIDGNILAVADSGINQGRLHIIRLNEDSTELIKTLSPSRELLGENDFGTGVFVKGNTIGAGAIHTMVHAIHDGRFSIFNIKENNIEFSEDFNPSPATAGRFGYDSAISGEVLCVSQYGNESWRRDAGFYFYKISNGKTKEFGRYIVPGDYSYAVALTAHNNKFFAAVRKPSKHCIISFSVIKDQSGNYTLKKVQELELIESEDLLATATLAKTNMQGLATNGNCLAVGDPENLRVSLFIIQEDGKLEWSATMGQLQIGSSGGNNRYGASVAFAENFLFIGQPNANEQKVFWQKINKPATDEPTWIVGDRGELVPHGLRDGERFGSAIAASDDKIAITGRGENSSSIYIFEKQVISSAVIALQPESQEVQLGGTAELTVEAKGEELSYQWYHEIPQDYQLTAVFKGNGTEIELGLPYSSLYNYKIGEIYKPSDWGLTIGGQPVSDGSGEIHIVEKSHEEPYLIPDAASSTYRIENITQVDLGSYFVRVTNNGGSVQSQIVTLNLIQVIEPDVGTLLWKFNAGGAVRCSPAIGSDGTVYFGANDKYLYAIYPDGNEKWKFKADSTSTSTAIGSDGTIYFGADKIYAFKPDGTKKWEYAESVERDTLAVGNNGTIYYKRGISLNALNSGEKLWTFTTGSDGGNTLPAIGSDGTIYTATGDYNSVMDDWVVKPKLYALNQNGSKKWESDQVRSNITGSPAIGNDGTVYFGTVYGKIYALSSNGVEKWSVQTEGFVSPPAIGSDGTVYFGSANHDFPNLNILAYLYAVSPSGKLKWKYEIEMAPLFISSPIIGHDETIYFGAGVNEGALYALSPNGTKKWIYKPDGLNRAFYSTPAIGNNGILYKGFSDGLYAFKISDTGKAISPWPVLGQNAQRTGRVSAPKINETIELKLSKSTLAPFTFTFTTIEGVTYEVQSSHDMKEWVKLEEVKGTSGESEFTDLREALFEKQYYRLKLVE